MSCYFLQGLFLALFLIVGGYSRSVQDTQTPSDADFKTSKPNPSLQDLSMRISNLQNHIDIKFQHLQKDLDLIKTHLHSTLTLDDPLKKGKGGQNHTLEDIYKQLRSMEGQIQKELEVESRKTTFADVALVGEFLVLVSGGVVYGIKKIRKNKKDVPYDPMTNDTNAEGAQTSGDAEQGRVGNFSADESNLINV